MKVHPRGHGFAGNEYSHAINKDSDTPWYLQLMAYVSQLTTAGEEVPKQLLQKIDQYYRQGR